jgi:hypothetical protein
MSQPDLHPGSFRSTDPGTSRFVFRVSSLTPSCPAPKDVAGDNVLSVFDLGQVPVVGLAEQPDVLVLVPAALPESILVVVLDLVPLGASPAFRIHEAALASVAPLDGASDGGGDVA